MHDFPAPYTDFLTHPDGANQRWADLRPTALEQLHKDLGFYQEDGPQHLENPLPELNVILRKVGQDRSRMMQLLYRIDVDSAQLETVLTEHQHDSAWKHLAALVWHRVLRKVWLRREFSRGFSSDLPSDPSV